MPDQAFTPDSTHPVLARPRRAAPPPPATGRGVRRPGSAAGGRTPGLVGYRYLLAVALLTGLATAPVVAAVGAGQAVLDGSEPAPAATGTPFRTPAGGASRECDDLGSDCPRTRGLVGAGRIAYAFLASGGAGWEEDAGVARCAMMATPAPIV